MIENPIDLEKVYLKLQAGEPLSDEEEISVAVLEKVGNPKILKEVFNIESGPGLRQKILALLRGKSAQES
jgi:hypothetical protein